MDQVIEFAKDNLAFIVFGLATVLLFAVMLTFFLKRPKKVVDKIKFEKNLQQAEKNHYKKCNKCNSDVPKDDNICQSCNQVPD